MTLIVRAFPGRARDRSELDAFLGEMRSRADEARRFYDAYGVRRSSWFFQGEPYGPLVIVVTDAKDPIEGNAARYAATDEPFAVWFKQRVIDVTGIDPNVTPLGPTSELVYEFES